MPLNVDVRAASLDDLDAITRFTAQLHEHEDNGELATHQKFFPRLKKWLRSELNDSKSLILIAETNLQTKSQTGSHTEPQTGPRHIPKQTIGFISATSIINDNGFLQAPSKGVIQLLWVELNYRQQGVADSLVLSIENCFKNIGIKYVECTYTSNNSLAESYWQRNDYKKNSITARKFI